MRRTSLLCIFVACIACLAQKAAAYDLEYKTQAVFCAAGNTGGIDLAPDVHLSGFFKGVVLWPITEGATSVVYGGADFQIGDIDVKALTGAKSNSGGTSLTVSTWVDVSRVFVDELEFFAEFDAYIPLVGHDVVGFYGDLELTGKISPQWSFGVKNEYYAAEDRFNALAIGPSLKVDAFSAWLAYQLNPHDPSAGAMFLRLTFCVH